MYLYYFLSGSLLRTITPPFGRLTSEKQELEGLFRSAHARLIRHSEEIAFYGGSDRELDLINENFNRVYKHTSSMYRLQGFMGIFENVFTSYPTSFLVYFFSCI